MARVLSSLIYCKRAEYGFGEHGFKHRTQWVFRGSLSSGERTQWAPFSLLFVCKRKLTEFFAELTEFAPKLSEAQWVLFSETVLSKQYSARFPYKYGNIKISEKLLGLGEEGLTPESHPGINTRKMARLPDRALDAAAIQLLLYSTAEQEDCLQI